MGTYDRVADDGIYIIPVDYNGITDLDNMTGFVYPLEIEETNSDSIFNRVVDWIQAIFAA